MAPSKTEQGVPFPPIPEEMLEEFLAKGYCERKMVDGQERYYLTELGKQVGKSRLG